MLLTDSSFSHRQTYFLSFCKIPQPTTLIIVHHQIMQKPQITEIQVRMDCNGCVHKIKKALGGINDLYINFPQQKITADQEKIVKAIKKTGKTATSCSLAEPLESPDQTTEPPDPAQQQPAEAAPPDETPPTQAEPPEDTAPPLPEATIPTYNNARQKSENILGTKDVGEVHEIHQYPTYDAKNYVGGWNRSHDSTIYSQETHPSMYMPHNYYNTYKPSPYHVREYECQITNKPLLSSQWRLPKWKRKHYFYI